MKNTIFKIKNYLQVDHVQEEKKEKHRKKYPLQMHFYSSFRAFATCKLYLFY